MALTMNTLFNATAVSADVATFLKERKTNRLPIGYTKQQNQIYKVAQKTQVE